MFDLKDLNLKKVKMVLSVILIQIFSFAVGLYSGYNFLPKGNQDSTNINNYNTNEGQNNDNNTKAPTEINASDDCKIKGNISSSSKIYHIQDGAFYERTTAEMCFNSEKEAQAAGFVKSSK